MIGRKWIFAVLIVSMASVASAGTVLFDPDSTANATNGSSLVSTFDPGPGNALAAGALGAGGVVNPLFTQYYQGAIAALKDSGGNIITVTGLGSTFELTVVVKFDAAVTGVSANATSFTVNYGRAPVAANNLVEVWYDPTPDANDLAGTGFNDGTLILSGSVLANPFLTSGAFTTTTAVFPGLNPTKFDQFGTDNYGGFQTLIGNGSLSLTAVVNYTDPTFFTDPINVVQFATANTSTVLPFTTVNPSGSFLGYVPNRGPINGLGPDVQNQADANFTLSVPTPEAAAGGIALLAAMISARIIRRRRAS